jgi:hypothetical protein
MSAPADLARRLAREAEAVCRHYLSHGHRCGRYWLVGDVQNTPGSSLYVRLSGGDHGAGAAGKWTDAATGEHGDLLDLIRENRELRGVGEAMDEARRFLCLPRVAADDWQSERPCAPAEAARRLFHSAIAVPGTQAEIYLHARRITAPLNCPSLRFHPSLWYREHDHAPRQSFPALLASVTDLRGNLTGIQRTWLDPYLPEKASIADPRRALGHLLGNGVWFGNSATSHPNEATIVAAGEGVETMLSLKSVLPALPVIAGLSANHLAALILPPGLRHLYIAVDNDGPGRGAATRLRARAERAGIETLDLVPVHADFNADLCRLGANDMLHHLASQLAADDIVRFVVRG